MMIIVIIITLISAASQGRLKKCERFAHGNTADERPDETADTIRLPTGVVEVEW